MLDDSCRKSYHTNIKNSIFLAPIGPIIPFLKVCIAFLEDQDGPLLEDEKKRISSSAFIGLGPYCTLWKAFIAYLDPSSLY